MWHFVEGLEPSDFEEDGALAKKLENMILSIQNPTMQLRMNKELKKLTVRTLHYFSIILVLLTPFPENFT